MPVENIGSIELLSGRIVDVDNFKVWDYNIEDVAHALGNICRFGGHCKEFYSVAQHAVLCSKFAESKLLTNLFKLERNAQIALAFYCLHHDDAEAYVGDCVRPLKTDVFKEREDALMESVWKALHVPFPTKAVHVAMKFVDDTLCVTEGTQLMSSAAKWWEANCPPPWDLWIIPQDPKTARMNYLARHNEIISYTGGATHA